VREPRPIKAKSAFLCREPQPYGAERAASAFLDVQLQRQAPPVREPRPIKAKSAFLCREPQPYGAERAASAFLILSKSFKSVTVSPKTDYCYNSDKKKWNRQKQGYNFE
ncbi:hypothetical protein ACFPT3_03135, partial [Ectobacillus antri]